MKLNSIKIGDAPRSAGQSLSSDEISVMDMERGALVIQSDYFETTLKKDDDKRNDKVITLSKRMVYNSYLKVVAKDGSAGIDKEH